MDLFADVVVDLPVEGPFTYAVPPALSEQASFGKRALVPLGRRKVTGYIVALKRSCAVEGVKPIADILDPAPIFDEDLYSFCRWVSDYYFAPLGEVLSLTHPATVNLKSIRRFTTTEKGAAAALSGVEAAIVKAARRGVTMGSLARRFRGAAVAAAAARLVKKGLLSEEVVVSGGTRERIEPFVAAVSTGAPPSPKRSPLQAKVYALVSSRGEMSLRRLREELGSVDGAVRRLVEKGLLLRRERSVARDPLDDITPRALDHEPNDEQRVAVEAIRRGLRSGRYSPFLLYGVTGSGKTLVYMKAVDEAVRRGRGVIFLVPEIALTPWPAAFLSERFPGVVAVLHSALSEGERYDQWRRILSGEARIVVGARSALFAPLRDTGLIIVDEEHEASYKQEEGVRYNARDCALVLGRRLGAAVVLGSATPSVETFHNAMTGKLTPLYLRKRVRARPLPEVDLEDMRGRKKEVISPRLAGLLAENLASGGQSLLLLNRRGYSSFIVCKDCGHTFRCVNCSVTLTFHKGRALLRCHYCDHAEAVPQACPDCRGTRLEEPAAGTERVEQEVRELLPGARIGRMDRDTTRRKGSARRIIDAVCDGSIDVLIGTQMVSKGHHFPGMTLVGVISGDTSLGLPDFRAAERTFQLITQAAGRAGRGERPARVLVQTLWPDHFCLRAARTHDYDAFVEEELRLRREAGYPPFVRLANITVEAKRAEAAAAAAELLRSVADGLPAGLRRRTTVLGPVPAAIERLRGRYRRQMIVKAARTGELIALLRALKRAFDAGRTGATMTVDMDPASTL
ncbi:MAG TPA: primosomal protein N' [Deltaproteobacteria bacterium]|nr:primosomal protein N' [Deltaproteobacteria bacterium]